jgi:PPP family 3-phenylpropionic acid transporter
VLRWLVMMLDPPLAGLMPVQALHGITYGATHLGAVHFMSANVPPERAGTAQALYSSVTAGIALGGATLAAGALYPAWGGKTYALMAVLAAAGTAAAVWLWHGGDGPRAAAPPH